MQEEEAEGGRKRQKDGVGIREEAERRRERQRGGRGGRGKEEKYRVEVDGRIRR